jgi:hypothetical protein
MPCPLCFASCPIPGGQTSGSRQTGYRLCQFGGSRCTVNRCRSVSGGRRIGPTGRTLHQGRRLAAAYGERRPSHHRPKPGLFRIRREIVIKTTGQELEKIARTSTRSALFSSFQPFRHSEQYPGFHRTYASSHILTVFSKLSFLRGKVRSSTGEFRCERYHPANHPGCIPSYLPAPSPPSFKIDRTGVWHFPQFITAYLLLYQRKFEVFRNKQ